MSSVEAMVWVDSEAMAAGFGRPEMERQLQVAPAGRRVAVAPVGSESAMEASAKLKRVIKGLISIWKKLPVKVFALVVYKVLTY